MRTWKKKLENLSLARKMILLYVLIFGIISVIVGAALQVTLNIYDSQIYEKSLQELNFFTTRVDDELTELEGLSYDLALDYTVQSQLSDILEHRSTSGYSFQTSKIRNLLTKEALDSELLAEMIYTDKKQIRYRVGNQYVELPTEIFARMLERSDKAKGAYVYQEPTDEFPYLVSARDIRKHLDYSMDYLGSLVFIADVGNMIEKHRESLESSSSTSLYVLSGENLIYQSPDADADYAVVRELIEAEPSATTNHRLAQGQQLQVSQKHYEIIRLAGEKYFICQLTSKKTGWTFINMFPYSDIYSMNSRVRNGLFLGFGCLFLCAVLVTRQMAWRIVAPLKKLTDSIQIVEEGRFQQAKAYLSKEKREDEAGVLTQEFCNMLDTITNLIHENYEKQLLLKDTQYRALQAQINPHFLYNTMNSINWMIRSGRNQEASEMLIRLSDLLRAAFRKNPESTVGEELELVRNYVAIQQVRYQRRAEFTVEACESAGDCLLPHMILQPLVENSIQYGVENSLNVCHIAVKVTEEDDGVLLEVLDDGPGMTAEELEAVRTLTMKPKGNGIGLTNITERLKQFFDGQARITVDSGTGTGTAVRIRIPRRQRMSEEKEQNHV